MRTGAAKNHLPKALFHPLSPVCTPFGAPPENPSRRPHARAPLFAPFRGLRGPARTNPSQQFTPLFNFTRLAAGQRPAFRVPSFEFPLPGTPATTENHRRSSPSPRPTPWHMKGSGFRVQGSGFSSPPRSRSRRIVNTGSHGTSRSSKIDSRPLDLPNHVQRTRVIDYFSGSQRVLSFIGRRGS
jgi:hypothetical protein